MELLFEDDTIVLVYVSVPKTYVVWKGYYTFVKETGYWYNQSWRWGSCERMGQAGQVKFLNAGLAQLVSASV